MIFKIFPVSFVKNLGKVLLRLGLLIKNKKTLHLTRKGFKTFLKTFKFAQKWSWSNDEPVLGV